MAQTPCVFKRRGSHIPYTPSSAVTAGDVVIQGTLLGIAPRDIAAGIEGDLDVGHNGAVYDVPKDNSNMSAAGTAIYWDADGSPVGGTALSGAFTTTATGNTFAGWNLEVAGTAVGTVRAFILSSFAVSVTTIDALTDVGTINHAAGAIIVGDGAKFEEVPVSGPLALTAAGLLGRTPGTVAAAGNSSANAATLPALMSLVTEADGTKGVKLPAAAAQAERVIINDSASALKVYPNTGDQINTTSAAWTLDAHSIGFLFSYDTTDWYAGLLKFASS